MNATVTTGNVVALPTRTKAAATKTATKKSPAKKKPAAKKAAGKTSKKAAQKISAMTKECPARKGSKRAKLWSKLKNGMTLADAREAGVPSRFIKKMAKSENLKIVAA